MNPTSTLKNAEVSPTTELESIRNRLNGMAQQIGASAGRTHRALDRLRGELPPQPATGGKPREVRSGMIGAINDILDEIQMAADAQSAANDTLETLA